MASPVGHTLAALIGYAATVNCWNSKPKYGTLAMYVLAANLPDIDFLPGIFLGDPGRFHHGITHSIGAAILFGVIVWIVQRIRTQRAVYMAMALSALYGSHLIIDWMTADYRPPFGSPLLWPFSMERYHFPVSIFINIERKAFLSLPTILHNLYAMIIEISLLTPLLAGVGYIALKTRFTNPQKIETEKFSHIPFK
ncbi:MAG: metal-dependent hydrolase [Desulfatirhabdiaceae bacterium]